MSASKRNIASLHVGLCSAPHLHPTLFYRPTWRSSFAPVLNFILQFEARSACCVSGEKRIGWEAAGSSSTDRNVGSNPLSGRFLPSLAVLLLIPLHRHHAALPPEEAAAQAAGAEGGSTAFSRASAGRCCRSSRSCGCCRRRGPALDTACGWRWCAACRVRTTRRHCLLSLSCCCPRPSLSAASLSSLSACRVAGLRLYTYSQLEYITAAMLARHVKPGGARVLQVCGTVAVLLFLFLGSAFLFSRAARAV